MIVNRLIEKEKDVRPHEVILEIKHFILDVIPSEHKLKPTATDDDLWEALKEKVRNYIKYQRKRNRGDYAVRTVQDIIDICSLHLLLIPETYIPQDNFKSAEELTEALNVESVNTMLLFHLGSGSTLNKLLDFVQEEHKRSSGKVKSGMKREAASQVRIAIIACSASLLFVFFNLQNCQKACVFCTRMVRMACCYVGQS